MKRTIVRDFINGESNTLKQLELQDAKIEKCWTIYDENEMWNVNKFSPLTGEPIKKGVDLEGLILSHGQGVGVC